MGGRKVRMGAKTGADAMLANEAPGGVHRSCCAGRASSSLGRSGWPWRGAASRDGSAALLRTHAHKEQGWFPSKVLLSAAGKESPERTNPANMQVHAAHWSRAR
jgi:hypothetical protein